MGLDASVAGRAGSGPNSHISIVMGPSPSLGRGGSWKAVSDSGPLRPAGAPAPACPLTTPSSAATRRPSRPSLLPPPLPSQTT